VTTWLVPFTRPGPSAAIRLNSVCTPSGPACGPKLCKAMPPRLIRAAALIRLICVCSDWPPEMPARLMIPCGAPETAGRATPFNRPGTNSVSNTISSDSSASGALNRSCRVCDADGKKPWSKDAKPLGPGKNAPMPAIKEFVPAR
jgi:hypothetical protein